MLASAEDVVTRQNHSRSSGNPLKANWTSINIVFIDVLSLNLIGVNSSDGSLEPSLLDLLHTRDSEDFGGVSDFLLVRGQRASRILDEEGGMQSKLSEMKDESKDVAAPTSSALGSSSGRSKDAYCMFLKSVPALKYLLILICVSSSAASAQQRCE